MEYESFVTKQANEYCEKAFGDKDPELKQIVHMEMTLDPEDEEDEAKRQKALKKMRKDNQLLLDSLKDRPMMIHDENGNLKPINFLTTE